MSISTIPTGYNHTINPGSSMAVDTSVDGKLESELSGGVDANFSGGLDTIVSGGLDTNLSGGVQTTLAGSVGTIVSGKLNTDNVLKLTGDAAAPVVTDSKIEILNLPRFTLQDIKDMAKVRVRIPNYSNVCFKIMGVELMSISMGGESQIITEPYVPTAAERCETECCEPDTRPFPGKDIKDKGITLSKTVSEKTTK